MAETSHYDKQKADYAVSFIECPKKQGKTELAAAVALLMTCGDGEQRAEVFSAAADRQKASIIFMVAADMVKLRPALDARCKILYSQKRIMHKSSGMVGDR